ncbi:MAG: protein-export membrane protein SecF [Treponema sp. CETP13]|nr:MAG: protein-export membrane protein SecF [Treponema sp. CETP13]
MKKIIHFSKLFVPFAIMSVAIILFGVFGLVTKGFNLGIDFQAGLIQEVAIAPSAVELTYDGSATVSVQLQNTSMSIVVAGVGAQNETFDYPYVTYDTVEKLVDGINTIDDVTAVLKAAPQTSTVGLFGNSAVSTVLSDIPYYLHYSGSDTPNITIEQVRSALEGTLDAVVKQTGKAEENTFQIRVSDDGTDPEVSHTIQRSIANSLADAFGADNYAIMQTDFIGSSFSSTLVSSSVLLVLGALALILIYASIRFHWDFALGAVLAVIHDALIMITFIVWARLEFNSTMIAAILTIVGYSINDTIVIFDRVRENQSLLKVNKFSKLIDISMSETLTRTIITSLTTLLAVFSLYFFTSGDMKEFALALIVGIVSGTYSTIYIAGGFTTLCRRNWKPSDEEKASQVKVVEY